MDQVKGEMLKEMVEVVDTYFHVISVKAATESSALNDLIGQLLVPMWLKNRIITELVYWIHEVLVVIIRIKSHNYLSEEICLNIFDIHLQVLRAQRSTEQHTAWRNVPYDDSFILMTVP